MRNFSVHPGYNLVTVGIILLISILSVSAVFALSPGSFEGGDGNLIGEDDGGATDWDTAPNLVIAPDILPPLLDDSFTSDGRNKAKEDDLAPPIDFGAVQKNKSDLLRFYVSNEQVDNENLLYLGWVRRNDGGSTTSG